MTRDEHIKAAEELLAGPFNRSAYPGGEGYHSRPTDHDLVLAQIHATLAAAMRPEPVVAPRTTWWSRLVTR